MNWESNTVMLYKPKNNIIYFDNESKHANQRMFNKIVSVLKDEGNDLFIIDKRFPSIWVRDYFPIQIDGEFVFFHPCYDYMEFNERVNYEQTDWVSKITSILGKKDIPLIDLTLDGGNILFNSSFVFISEKVFADNKNRSKKEIRQILTRTFNGRELIVLQVDPHDPTGHVDGMIGMLDDNTILINDYTKVEEEIHTNNMRKLGNKINAVEIPFFWVDGEVIKGWPSNEGNYVNFIATKNSLIFSSFNHPDMESEIAEKITNSDSLKRPISFINTDPINKYGGGLHCITYDFSNKNKKD